jgi:Xaa-Pro aminopeptidase
VVHAKAIKNAAELEGMREAHLRDAVAICDFLNWLENKVGRAWECVNRFNHMQAYRHGTGWTTP